LEFIKPPVAVLFSKIFPSLSVPFLTASLVSEVGAGTLLSKLSPKLSTAG